MPLREGPRQPTTSRVGQALLLTFLISLGLNWPDLPFNARLPELLIVPLLVALAIDGVRPSWHRLDVYIAAYLLGAVPSLALSPAPAIGAIELAREGYLVVIYLAISGAVRAGYLRTIAIGLALSGGVLAAIGVAFMMIRSIAPFDLPAMGEIMALPYLGNVLRLRALTASEAMLACVFTTALPFAIATAAATDRRNGARGWLAVTAVILTAAAFTFSHALAGLAVAAVIAAWPLLAPVPFLKRSAVAVVLLVVVAFNVAATASVRSIGAGDSAVTDPTAYHYSVDSGRVEIGSTAIEYEVMSYLRLKQVALDAFLSNPIAGIGLDRFHAATEQAFQRGQLTAIYRAVDPHSSLPGRLAECGLIGGLTLLSLWFAFGREGAMLLTSQGPDAWIARAAVAGLAGLLVNSINADVMNFRFLWVGLGLVRGVADRRAT